MNASILGPPRALPADCRWARAAMYAQGMTACIRAADISAGIPGRSDLYGDGDDWLSRGNSAIVGPAADDGSGLASR